MSVQTAIESVTDHYVATGLPLANMAVDIVGVFFCIWAVVYTITVIKRTAGCCISDEEADKMSLKEYLSQKVD